MLGRKHIGTGCRGHNKRTRRRQRVNAELFRLRQSVQGLTARIVELEKAAPLSPSIVPQAIDDNRLVDQIARGLSLTRTNQSDIPLPTMKPIIR